MKTNYHNYFAIHFASKIISISAKHDFFLFVADRDEESGTEYKTTRRLKFKFISSEKVHREKKLFTLTRVSYKKLS